MLDLFCGAGGASRGYARAGFRVVGVDINPQPNYPFEFVQANAVKYAWLYGHWYDAIAASPPCQVHSDLASLAGPGHVDLIPETRWILRQLWVRRGTPYVIENVEGAPLYEPLMLCGSMFGLGAESQGEYRRLKRHRLFESPIELTAPRPCSCAGESIGGVYGDGGGGPMTRGYKFPVRDGRAAMRLHGTTRAELSQAIPPAYTEHLGRQLMAFVTGSPDAENDDWGLDDPLDYPARGA